MNGFNEIQRPPKRYTVIDRSALLDLFGVKDEECFRVDRQHWVDTELEAISLKRKGLWSESLAVGRKDFVEKIQNQLKTRASGRTVAVENDGNVLEEPQVSYSTLFKGEKSTLRPDNSYFIDINAINSDR